MGNLAEYFEANRYTPVYQVGDRVTGVHGGARWIGTVQNDTLVSEFRGPELHVRLDLPLKVDGLYRNFLVVQHEGVKKLVNF